MRGMGALRSLPSAFPPGWPLTAGGCDHPRCSDYQASRCSGPPSRSSRHPVSHSTGGASSCTRCPAIDPVSLLAPLLGLLLRQPSPADLDSCTVVVVHTATSRWHRCQHSLPHLSDESSQAASTSSPSSIARPTSTSFAFPTAAPHPPQARLPPADPPACSPRRSPYYSHRERP